MLRHRPRVIQTSVASSPCLQRDIRIGSNTAGPPLRPKLAFLSGPEASVAGGVFAPPNVHYARSGVTQRDPKQETEHPNWGCLGAGCRLASSPLVSQIGYSSALSKMITICGSGL